MHPAGELSQLNIRIDDKTYTGANGEPVTAVRALELAVRKDGFTVLIGPSGCGKTTILRILAGLDEDFTGNVQRVDEQRIGVVFQEPRLLPWRIVHDNIMLTADAEFGNTELNALAEELGIGPTLDRFPGELSLGLARRVALARAFAAAPDMLLLDEPFVSLDNPTAARLRRLLIRVWSTRRITTIMVTHNLREAIQLADRIVVLTQGPARVHAIIDIPTNQRDRNEEEIERLHGELMHTYPNAF